mgnify:CR=1 FL=1
MKRVFLILFVSAIFGAGGFVSVASATHSNQQDPGVGHQDQGNQGQDGEQGQGRRLPPPQQGAQVEKGEQGRSGERDRRDFGQRQGDERSRRDFGQRQDRKQKARQQ